MRDWKPIKKGLEYCSPACGYGCTYEKYTDAVNKSLALVKRCNEEIGGEWESRVHENLGWHWYVIQKNTNIRISHGGYLAKGDYYDVGFGGGTPIEVSVHPETFYSPKEAYDRQVEMIQKQSNRWVDILKNVNLQTK